MRRGGAGGRSAGDDGGRVEGVEWDVHGGDGRGE